ncbi:MAG: hypothetical protein NXH82_17315 [Rhodobacteraceae bacterium]|nr:hypothetical protein [Paracoccaceae bacterium]
MFRYLTAACSGLAFMLAGVAAGPAHAGNDDLARFLAGAAALAILGAAVRDSRADPVTRHAPQPHVRPLQPPVRAHRPHAQPAPRALPRDVARYALPANCLRSFDTHRGTVRLFPQRCLWRNSVQVGALPQDCARSIQTRQGPRHGYAPRCLRQYGYRLANG